ncbi:hypothetical protein BRADI_3g23341v3 [Brachypodium distachyon]|uniref:Uncharacterized protein n=1 Tax=Brachypodium distachyon TaxID=15368 RepID=A0A2K2CZ31_BRADI|nr:hypothetical protein BRADI_3g23341v3 [Brachypodium distachyon]
MAALAPCDGRWRGITTWRRRCGPTRWRQRWPHEEATLRSGATETTATWRYPHPTARRNGCDLLGLVFLAAAALSPITDRVVLHSSDGDLYALDGCCCVFDACCWLYWFAVHLMH